MENLGHLQNYDNSHTLILKRVQGKGLQHKDPLLSPGEEWWLTTAATTMGHLMPPNANTISVWEQEHGAKICATNMCTVFFQSATGKLGTSPVGFSILKYMLKGLFCFSPYSSRK